jgi:Icc-related predicted phosphoesterase
MTTDRVILVVGHALDADTMRRMLEMAAKADVQLIVQGGDFVAREVTPNEISRRGQIALDSLATAHTEDLLKEDIRLHKKDRTTNEPWYRRFAKKRSR